MIDLSVLLITFNNEKHIDATLKSVLSQKCTFNFEIVVGDDCSSDRTIEIINSYNLKYPGVFNIKKNNSQLGILKNFKTTLDRCQGNYIFDIAGDDLLNNNKVFEKMVSVFKNNPELGFVDSGYNKFYDVSGKTELFVNEIAMNVSKKDYIDFISLGKVIPIGVCYNKNSLYKYVDFEYYISQNITIEDYPILVDLINHADFGRINESLHTYRIHKASDSQISSFEKYFSQRNQMFKLFKRFKNKYQFSENLIKTFEQAHYKTILHLAGSFEKKDLGKETFNKIESKSIYDIIHYLSSQYKIVRNIAKIRKFKNLILNNKKT